jgi:hypothetical protein
MSYAHVAQASALRASDGHRAQLNLIPANWTRTVSAPAATMLHGRLREKLHRHPLPSPPPQYCTSERARPSASASHQACLLSKPGQRGYALVGHEIALSVEENERWNAVDLKSTAHRVFQAPAVVSATIDASRRGAMGSTCQQLMTVEMHAGDVACRHA